METLTRFKNHSFDVQLFTVLLFLFFLSCILGQKFIFFQTISFPLFSLVGSLFVWMFVKNQNKIRRGIGFCLIIILMCGTIFQGFPLSHKVALFATYPFIVLCLWEFTKVALNDLKVLVLWLSTFPLFVLTLGENFLHEKEQWIFLLAYPVIWILMSLYSNAKIFKKAVKYVGFILVTLLILIYLAIDIISLGAIEQLMQNQSVKDFFGSSQTVPILHLIFTVFFVPSIITCIICYFIADKRIKRIPFE